MLTCRRAGQAFAEYVIIAALSTFGLLLVVTFFG